MSSIITHLSDYFKTNVSPVCIIGFDFRILKSNEAFDFNFKNHFKKKSIRLHDLFSSEECIQLKNLINIQKNNQSIQESNSLKEKSEVYLKGYLYDLDTLEIQDIDAYYLTFSRQSCDEIVNQDKMIMYESIIQNKREAIICADLKGNILFVNDSGLSMYGYTESEIIGENIDVFTDKKNDRTKEIVQALEDFGSFTGNVMHTKKNLSTFPCDLKIDYVFNSTGHPFGLIGSCKDISLQQKAVEIIKESSLKELELEQIREISQEQVEKLRIYQNIIENNWDAIVFADLKGTIIFSNESTSKLYGYTGNELQGKNIDTFNPKEATHISAMVSGLKDFGGWSGEVLHIKKSKEVFDVLLTVSMVFDDQGRPFALISTCKDITDRKLAQKNVDEKNAELNRVKDRFVQDLEIKVQERTSQLQIEQEKSNKLLLNILPFETATELKENGSATPRHYDLVTILFTDFVGFSRLSENLSPTELIEHLGYFFTKFDETIAQFNLEKIKTIGDSYMCAGGLPVENTTHARDAICAGLELQKFVKTERDLRIKKGLDPWDIRVGIHTGPIVAGVVGSKKFAYDIWGDSVNIASRIESSGAVGKVNISSATYELIKNDFECEHRGHISVKNRDDIEMYYVNKKK